MLLDANKQTTVLARRWDSFRSALLPVLPGTTLENVVLDAIQGLRRDGLYTRAQARKLARYSRCRVDGVEIKRSEWKDYCPAHGANIEVIQGVKGGGGGGGGKNPVSVIATVAIIAAAAWAGPALAGAMGLTQVVGGATVLTGTGMFVAGLTSAAITMGGMMAINALDRKSVV